MAKVFYWGSSGLSPSKTTTFVTGAQTVTNTVSLPTAKLTKTGETPLRVLSARMYLAGKGGTRTANLKVGIRVTSNISLSNVGTTIAEPRAYDLGYRALTVIPTYDRSTVSTVAVGFTTNGDTWFGRYGETADTTTLWGACEYLIAPTPGVISVSSITSTSFVVSSTASDDGGTGSTTSYIEVWTTPSFTAGTQVGTYTSGSTVSGLTPSTTYYFRAYANNTIWDSAYTTGSYSASTTAPENPQATGSQKRFSIAQNFTASLKNQGIYVSTNGYVQIGGEPTSSTSISTSGIVVSPLAGDLRQTNLWTYDNGTNYYVRWTGAYYNAPSETVDYQIKFYYNSSTVDIYIVTNNLSSITPSTQATGYNGGNLQYWSSGSSVSISLISTGSMTEWDLRDGVDDSYTIVSDPTVYSVAFNPNGGIFTSDSSISVKTITQAYYGSSIGVPAISRAGYTFNGWYNAPSGGSLVISSSTTNYTPSSTINVYAQWSATAPVFSDQTITNTGVLAKNISTNPDRTVTASPVSSYSVISSGTGLDPTSWLSINSSGELSGIPSQIGVYTFKVRAASNGFTTDTSELTLTIYPAGKRMTGSGTSTTLTIAKRFDGTNWVNLKVMKRFDGTTWTDISNV